MDGFTIDKNDTKRRELGIGINIYKLLCIGVIIIIYTVCCEIVYLPSYYTYIFIICL